MGLSIHTNMASCNAQRLLNGDSSSLGAATGRMSTSLRIDISTGLHLGARTLDMPFAKHNANGEGALAQNAGGTIGALASLSPRMQDLTAHEMPKLIDRGVSFVKAFATPTLSKHGSTSSFIASVISKLISSVQNNTASKSYIMDAGIAAQTSLLIRTQIQQRAGTAILSQANLNNRSVLSLLR